jgi:hypothetical protein
MSNDAGISGGGSADNIQTFTVPSARGQRSSPAALGDQLQLRTSDTYRYKPPRYVVICD